MSIYLRLRAALGACPDVADIGVVTYFQTFDVFDEVALFVHEPFVHLVSDGLEALVGWVFWTGGFHFFFPLDGL